MFDTILVGGGTAGCVLAHRLSADPGRKVLLLEAGGEGETLKVRVPGMCAWLMDSDLDWRFRTEPQAHTEGRRHLWPRGKCLGGSSSINNMIYIRGNPADYDRWAALGNEGWAYERMLPLFRLSEDNERGPSRYHGVGGPLHVKNISTFPLIDLLIEGLAEHFELPLNDDFNGADPLGFGRFQVTQVGRERCSAARAFLAPARGRPNLTVRTGAHALGLRIEGDRVTGVRYLRQGSSLGRSREETAYASSEVILAGGAIGTPQLLLLSGVGPPEALRAHGIPVRHALPGVGEGLTDHLAVALTYRERAGLGIDPSPANLLRWTAEHFLLGRGPMVTNLAEGGGFLRLRSSAELPDIQLHLGPIAGDKLPEEGPVQGVPHSFSVSPTLLYPKSRGRVRLRSADPLAHPAIDPRYFSEPDDLELLLEAVEASRGFVRSSPRLKGVVGEELWPGEAVRGKEALRRAIARRASTLFHPVGTCRMGVDEEAVVDPSLRVRGLSGLRVADASIMPTIVGGNTCAPVIAIAEKAAQLVLQGS